MDYGIRHMGGLSIDFKTSRYCHLCVCVFLRIYIFQSGLWELMIIVSMQWSGRRKNEPIYADVALSKSITTIGTDPYPMFAVSYPPKLPNGKGWLWSSQSFKFSNPNESKLGNETNCKPSRNLPIECPNTHRHPKSKNHAQLVKISVAVLDMPNA